MGVPGAIATLDTLAGTGPAANGRAQTPPAGWRHWNQWNGAITQEIIEGKVEGRVNLPNNEITVGADGRITADIEAKSIIVIGQTAGNLTATQRVEVQATGSVEGDITAPRLQIQEGASVNGSISMTKAPVAAGAKDTPAATPIAGQERRSA